MKDPESNLARSMLLPELRLKRFLSYKGKWSIQAEKRSASEVCIRCANLSTTVYDRRWIEVKDEPVRNRLVLVRIRKRRFFCKPCQKPFSEPVPGILPRRRTTQRFRAAVLDACENYQSLKAVQKKFRCSSSLIYGALYEQLELRRRTRQYPWPEVLGIDEISFRRSKKYRGTDFASVIVDIKNKRVMELVDGKRGEDLFNALNDIPGRENVKLVAIDMCDPFRKFIREFFPNAKIVADKFHALRLITPTILTTLKEEIPAFNDRRYMRSLLLRRPQSLEFSERSRLQKFLQVYPKLNALYEAKERLFSLYSIRFSDQAPAAFNRLLEFLKLCGIKELDRLRSTLKRWQNEILGYFHSHLTNGRTEGFNNKIKLVKRMAYGYRSFRNFRLRVLNACAG